MISRALGLSGVFAAICGSASAEIVQPETELLEALPGTSIRIFYMLTDSQTPLLGYSLDIDAAPSMGVGTVEIDAGASSFFDDKNLITAGGKTRDGIFSVIESDGSGGAFVSTNTDDLSTVLANPGVNDVLADIEFDISEDAIGDFVFTLGRGTALSDASGFAVGHEIRDLTIRVIPGPASIALLGLGGLVASSRRR